MEYKNFENHIGESLRNDESTLDIQTLIHNIHLPEKKKRRGFFFLFLCIGFIALSGTAYYVVNANTLKSVKTDDNIDLKDKQEIVVDKPASIVENSDDLLVSKGDTEGPQNIRKTTNPVSLTSRGIKQGETKNSIVTNIDSSEDYILEKDEDKNQDRRFIISESMLENKTFESIKSIKSIELSFQSDKIVCPSFSNKNKLYLEIIPEIGVFYPMKKLKSGISEFDNRFTLRNKDESTLEGFQVGLYGRIRKQKSPFYLSGGLSYSKLTEKMSLKYEYSRLDTTQGIISITVSQTGDTITTIYGDIVREHNISGSKVAHYSFSLIDIPVAIGFEKSINQWVYGMEAGINLNLSMNVKGNILATDTSFVNIENVKSEFNQSLGLSYFGGLLVGREFDRMGRLYLATRFRFIPEDFSSNQNSIRQNYQFLGINLGYIVRF